MSLGLLLLDVDGPLNPYRKWLARGYVTYRDHDGKWGRSTLFGRGNRVRLNPSHGGMLTALAKETGLELVWATAWEHAANERVAPVIGLDRLPVIEFPETDVSYDHRGYLSWRADGGWKWPAVSAYADGRPLAWLDDEHGESAYAAARAAFDRDRAGCPTLLWHVDPRHGLRPADLDRIRGWAADLPRTDHR